VNMELKPITRLKEVYRIEELISASELSYVYVGHHIRTGDKCVIKEFFPAAAANRDVDGRTVLCRSPLLQTKYEELLAAFQNEIELLKTIDHPHIVSYKDDFQENGTLYLVEEYCPGETLEQYIQRNEFIGTAVFFRQTLLPLLHTLSYLHERGIIHRDLKPGNIMIGPGGVPKLLDFGAAIDMTREERKQIFTTPSFSPLEFYSDKSRQGSYSDIYSLAAVLYYGLSGSRPLDVPKRIIGEQIEPIGRCSRRGVTPWFSYAIMRGLAVRNTQRFETVRPLIMVVKAEYWLLKVKEKLRLRQA
jgi:serine/threonine protein kinase